MANAPLSLNMEYFNDPITGKPLFNGSVWIGSPDLDPEIEVNRVTVIVVQEDGTEVTILPSAQPLTINAGGRIEYVGQPVVVKVDGVFSIKVRDSLLVQKYYAPRANEVDVTPTDTGVNVQNGSFEIETVTGLSDSWAFAPYVNGSVAPDSTSQAHGLKSLKFIGVDANGGGIATSDRFDTAENIDLDVRFIYKTSNAATLNKVEVKFYDAAGAPVSTVTAYSNGATNPLVYTPYFRRITVPANGVEAEVILTGLDPLGTVAVGNTNFDNISIDESNPVIETVNVDDAVNRISISDAITGENPSIDISGEDVGLDIEGVTLKNGATTSDSTTTDSITPKTTDGDLALTRNGTGDITIDGVPTYGLVVLDTPELIAPAPLVLNTWTAVNSTTLNAASAVKAVLRVSINDTNPASSTTVLVIMNLRKTGSAIPVSNATRASIGREQISSAITGLNASDISEATINLDSNSDFDYYYQSSAGYTLASEIYLIGYYV